MKRKLFSLLSSRAAAQPRAVLPPARRSRAAQAYLESILVLLVLFLLLFGFLQAALLYGGRDVLHHAASRAARARAVGFNDWMAEKAARVAAIPVSGHLLAEDVGWEEEPGADMAAFELARIPGYLASENHARAQYVLDYEEWRRGSIGFGESGCRFRPWSSRGRRSTRRARPACPSRPPPRPATTRDCTCGSGATAGREKRREKREKIF